jgi:hypothetical protein
VVRSFVEVEHPLVCCIGPAVVVVSLKGPHECILESRIGPISSKSEYLAQYQQEDIHTSPE